MVNYVKIGVESVFGTHVTTTGIHASSVNEDIDHSPLIEENIDNYVADAAYGGPLKISGTLEGNIRPKEMGAIFNAFFGDASSPYTLGVPVSLSIDVGEEIMNHEMQYTGCGITKLSMSFAAKEFCTFSADWFAKTYVIGAYSVPSIAAEDPAVFYNAALSIGGSTSTKIKEITLDMDRKLDADNYVLNDFTLHRLARTGVTSIGGTITFAEDEYTEYNKAMTGSATGIGTAPDTNNVLGTSALIITCTNMAGTTSLTISLPVSCYTKGGKKIDKVSEVEKTVDYIVTGPAATAISITVAA